MLWGTAFKIVQEGITAVSDDDRVLVEQGTYTENIAFWGKNTTLRSTDSTGCTVIDGNSVVATGAFAGSENDTCVLSGFTIRNRKGTLSRRLLATAASGSCGMSSAARKKTKTATQRWERHSI